MEENQSQITQAPKPHAPFKKRGSKASGHGSGSNLDQTAQQVEISQRIARMTQNCLNHKEQADELYDLQQYEEALGFYQKAIKTINLKDSNSSHLQALGTTNIIPILEECMINSSLCHYYQRQYKYAITYCSDVLSYSPTNAKAFYIKGRCYEFLKDIISARDCYKEAYTIHPMDKDIKKKYLEMQNAVESEVQNSPDSPVNPISPPLTKKKSVVFKTVDIEETKLKLQKVESSKRGGVVKITRDPNIENILKLNKPRSLSHLVKMALIVLQNWIFSAEGIAKIVFFSLMWYIWRQRRRYRAVYKYIRYYF